MSTVFVSYKREDEKRVSRLVRALEGTGLSLWWDQGLPGAENWRQQIQFALDSAKCVIVVWTRESVGAAGDFVRDEAGQAKRRGVLVPVMLDKVALPLGFGEIQAIDLAHWRGNPHDPSFQDLCAAVKAKLEGRAVPPARGPMKRLVRRLTYTTLSSAIGFCAAAAFGLNLLTVQDRLCDAPVFQPTVSDMCGAVGVGHRPTKAERVAWERRPLGDCAGLRTYTERFPDGALRDRAAAMLTARRVTQAEIWVPGKRRLTLFVGSNDAPATTETLARLAALARAQPAAERLCRGFTATTLFRLRSAKPEPQSWDCRRVSGGVVCGFEGEALCEVEERQVQVNETCGQ